MELWIVAVLFVAMLTGCIICSVAAYSKNKKFMVLAVLLGVATLILGAYAVLTLIFVNAIQ